MGKLLSLAVEGLWLWFSQKNSVFAETETSKAKNSMFPEEFGDSETAERAFWIELFDTNDLRGRTSKTEFVCKSYGRFTETVSERKK